jgi:DNA-binding CsgD family transcriptional regulator
MPRGGKRPGSGRKAAPKKAERAAKPDPLIALSARKRIYLESLATGKTKRQSALDAGYAESVARTAKEHIETPDLRKAFATLIQSVIPAEKIVARIAEGLDAMETKVFSFQGTIFDQTDLIAWTERREYAKMAAEYGEYFVSSPQKMVHSGKVTLEALVCGEKEEEQK